MNSKSQIEQGKRNLEKARTPEAQRNRRLNQIKWEEDFADELRKDGWEVFSPTVVCDRIGIKDGNVYFIEFKKPNQELREGQQKIYNLSKDNYRIFYK